ncbi:reverse transcriptase domain-containing protein [Peribacillus simplex]|uniref:Reverse transcriptase domain-containing protein n=1 Tax=Peribacillus simplex TaxID=1478 RepID=A0AAW7ISE7_9BACI|nr:reverse transcriptase domain-containing protein [Peribacillus simplex]MDM5294270.1 reverse transcriptase domain-containing protein [Peribacillus simplex]MDM5453223.1 reverse transcriptase domain-containing protein [Peribacillus simplex]
MNEHLQQLSYELEDRAILRWPVISPVLANLFLHYTFDKWMAIYHPNNPFARYADEVVIHCKIEEEAKNLLESLNKRMKEYIQQKRKCLL